MVKVKQTLRWDRNDSVKVKTALRRGRNDSVNVKQALRCERNGLFNMKKAIRRGRNGLFKMKKAIRRGRNDSVKVKLAIRRCAAPAAAINCWLSCGVCERVLRMVLIRLLLGLLRLLARCALGLLRLCVRIVRTRIGRFGAALVVLILSVRGCSGPSLRVGTFNVRELGVRTDWTRLSELLSDAEFDVMALQEIQVPQLMPSLAERVSKRSGRTYRSVVSDCGGKRTMHVGFLYDAERLDLDRLQEFPELRDDRGGSCQLGARAGLLGEFSTHGWFRQKRYSFLTVHFPAGGNMEQVRERQLFWSRALHIATRIRDSGQENVLVLGDVNSTGYRDNSFGERDAIHDIVERAGFQVMTPNVGCTEYFQPSARGTFEPSHLDHVVGSATLRASTAAQVRGFCATLRCASTQAMPNDYHTVSDHCPVTLDLK